MTKVEPITNESVRIEGEVLREKLFLPSPIDRILQRLSCTELPAKEHFERYMRHKWRLNHKPRTLASSFTPAAEGHGLCPWMNAPTFGRDVAPLGRKVGCNGLCPWGSTFCTDLYYPVLFPWTIETNASSREGRTACSSINPILFVVRTSRIIRSPSCGSST